MGSVNRIDSIYDVGSIEAEQQKVENLVKASIEQIRKAREESISFNVDTKNFSDYAKKVKDLEKVLSSMTKVSTDAVKASTLLAKQKEAEAKALLASQKATQNATKETERLAAADKKAAQAAQDAQRPYKQLALAFAAAAKNAQDLGAKYGTLDKRAQAAAKTANALNDKLKAIDTSIGNNQRNVGNYKSALEGVGNSIKNVGLQLLAIAGLGSIFQDSIDEFVQMDKNVRILQNTLRNVGVPEAFGRIEESANRLAKQFTFLDNDDILKTFNQLVVFGKLTEDQINELIPVIIDFATAQGLDLATATSQVIKVLEGNGKVLKEYGIDVKDAKNTTEAFGLVMTQLAPKVSGVAKTFQDSAAGGLASAKQEFKDLKEEIGAGLLPILNSVLSVLLEITKGAVGAGRALFDALTGAKSFSASILEGADNEDIAKEADRVFKREINTLAEFQKELKERQKAGKLLDKTELDLQTEFVKGLENRLAERQKAYDSIKKSNNRQAIMDALADLRGLKRAVDELNKGAGIKPTTDPNKPFTTPGAAKAVKVDNSEFERRKADLELAKEFDQKRLENDKASFQERTQALIDFGNDSAALIELQAENELKAADLTASQRLKIENDKNNALIRLSQELGEKLAKLTARSFTVDTSTISSAVKGLPAEIQKAIDDYKKAQDKFIEDHEKALEKLKEDTKAAITSLASELEGLFFDIFTNQIERQKNAIQDQIDLLEAQKQKDIEVANQTITNAQEKADAIAIIEARAAAKRQQLELRQRQLDQQKARFEKARAVTDIVQSTALAVVNALTQVKTLGPGAIALAALIGAIGAVQIARVLAQPIPRYAEGTDFHKGGLAVVGDGGKSEAMVMPDGSIHKSPSSATVVDLPRGTKVFPDYNTLTQAPVYNVTAVDTTAELRRGFSQVVGAIKHIPQPIIKSERAWTQAHKIGSDFRNYINRSI